jgi:hypothetical protein
VATKHRASLSETGELGRTHSPFKDLYQVAIHGVKKI